MRSALGLRRIGAIDVSQVLRASESDIYHLQSRLRTWGVPSFKSYPLLLRALTHPSMSNWAERVLRAPKRSLGPNTLELLGDRVLGTCVAATVHDWIREQGEGGAARLHALEPWSTRFGASSVVASLVANRGLAAAAREMGLEDLIRWEKPMPPSAHRARLDERGVDVATGIGVNREVNALAAAYEAVAAAVYLDGGYEAARRFVETTLLQRPRVVQKANAGLKEHQRTLVNGVARWIGGDALDVESVGLEGGREEERGMGRVQCGVFDMQACIEGEPLASPIFYAAVVLRKGEREGEEVREGELLAVASHFSVEMARIAAAVQAIQVLQGRRPAANMVRAKHNMSKVRLEIAVEDRERVQAMDIEFGASDGKWVGDGDYVRVASVLNGVGASDLGRTPLAKTTATQESMRERVQEVWVEREGSEEAKNSGRDGAHGYGGRGRRQWFGRGVLCERTISECLEIGGEVNSGLEVHQRHGHFVADTANASDICTAVYSTVKRLNETERWWQLAEVRGYNSVGTQMLRLWSVQRSMREAGQDRAEVVGLCEERVGKAGVIGRRLVGGDGLDFVEQLPRMRKEFVGLGIVVKEIGTNTALRWLSGAEALAQGGREAEAEGGMGSV